MGFFNISNIKWNIIIMLIIVQKQNYTFNTSQFFHGYM
jgi:hypothetical protein